MSVPVLFRRRLAVPVIASPMFLVSGPELVIACCRAGVAGTFPSLNARSAEDLAEWLKTIDAALRSPQAAPFGVNLILHASNPRRDVDLEVSVRHRVPFVVTSLGNPEHVVEAVHAYGGVVFSDVVHAQHARKCIAAGVDGLIAVGSGAGGHAGVQSLFSLARELREFWKGALVLGGAIADGHAVRAAEVLGADLAYVGTRFIATQEARAQPEFKQMLVDATAADIVYTDAISGTPANFLRASLEKSYGMDWMRVAAERRADGPKAWRDVWSAGHGVATIRDLPMTAELVARFRVEYEEALALPRSAAMA